MDKFYECFKGLKYTRKKLKITKNLRFFNQISYSKVCDFSNKKYVTLSFFILMNFSLFRSSDTYTHYFLFYKLPIITPILIKTNATKNLKL